MKKDTVHAMVTVDNTALRAGPEQTRRMINDKLIRHIVEQIVADKVMEEVGNFSTTFRISLVVKSPDDYFRDIQRMAMDYSIGLPQFIEQRIQND